MESGTSNIQDDPVLGTEKGWVVREEKQTHSPPAWLKPLNHLNLILSNARNPQLNDYFPRMSLRSFPEPKPPIVTTLLFLPQEKSISFLKDIAQV